MYNPDVLVIGTGTAGQTAAYDLCAEGYQVAIVEKSERPGGVCALSGCQAKKWFYEVTETVARARHLQGLGVTAPPTVNWNDILIAKNRFTSKIPEDTVAGLKGNGITYLQGNAEFLDGQRVRLGADIFTPKFTIIATGARPMDLPITGAELLTTSSEFLDLEALPKRLVFVGGGFISFELAHFAARLGADPAAIHIIEVMERPLGPFDSDMVSLLIEATRAEGIQIHNGVSIETINRTGSGYLLELADGTSLETDLVVHGAGRVPDFDDLGLDSAGIDYSRQGIGVDGNMQTSLEHVYAVGDAAATIQLARVADREAHQAAASIIACLDQTTPPEPIHYGAVPAVLFTYPQLGMVGQTEDELQRDGIKYWKSFDKNIGWPTYRRIGLKHAAYKILVADDGRILGAHILSDNCTGLLNTIKQAMLDGTTVQQLHRDNIMSPYPSRESDILYMLGPLLD